MLTSIPSDSELYKAIPSETIVPSVLLCSLYTPSRATGFQIGKRRALDWLYTPRAFARETRRRRRRRSSCQLTFQWGIYRHGLTRGSFATSSSSSGGTHSRTSGRQPSPCRLLPPIAAPAV